MQTSRNACLLPITKHQRKTQHVDTLLCLQDRGYVERHGRTFHATTLGRLLSAFLTHYFSKYVDYGFTAGLEEQLDEIAGAYNRVYVRRNAQQQVLSLIAYDQQNESETTHLPRFAILSPTSRRNLVVTAVVAGGRAEWQALLGEFWGPFKGTVEGLAGVSVTEVFDMLDAELGPHFFPTNTDQQPLLTGAAAGSPAGDGRVGEGGHNGGGFAPAQQQLLQGRGAAGDAAAQQAFDPRRCPLCGGRLSLKPSRTGGFIGERPCAACLPLVCRYQST